jgi:hypothetical protein
MLITRVGDYISCKGLILRLHRRLKDNIKTQLIEVVCNNVNWMKFAQGFMLGLTHNSKKHRAQKKIRKIS